MRKKILLGVLIGVAFIGGYLYAAFVFNRELSATRTQNLQLENVYNLVYADNVNIIKNLKTLCGVLKEGYQCPKDLLDELNQYEENQAVFIPTSTIFVTTN